MNLTHLPPVALLLALVLGTVAVGRAARLVTSDDWPPMLAVRLWWLTWQTNRDNPRITGSRYRGERSGPLHGWGSLLTCPFCFAPYAAAVNLGWAVWSGLAWGEFWGTAWWLVNTWAAVSYLAAMLVARDEPADE